MDPALATVVVAGIGAVASLAGVLASRAGKKREMAMEAHDRSFVYLEKSRNAAIEDAERARQEREQEREARFIAEASRDALAAHLQACITAMIDAGVDIPTPPEELK